ncbi:hypothetical protein [Asaia bogorensis]|uniref:hypothetical protein n=1 Tax=Asaia bogorensis TaxID=91915 RepID=UPI0013C4EB65|nr:hypothetical protein [Asaia bogorensis]
MKTRFTNMRQTSAASDDKALLPGGSAFAHLRMVGNGKVSAFYQAADTAYPRCFLGAKGAVS